MLSLSEEPEIFCPLNLHSVTPLHFNTMSSKGKISPVPSLKTLLSRNRNRCEEKCWCKLCATKKFSIIFFKCHFQNHLPLTTKGLSANSYFFALRSFMTPSLASRKLMLGFVDWREKSTITLPDLFRQINNDEQHYCIETRGICNTVTLIFAKTIKSVYLKLVTAAESTL